MLKAGLILLVCVALASTVLGQDISLDEPEAEVKKISLPTCALCKTVVKEISLFIKDNRTEEAIENALSYVCGIIYQDGSDNWKECNDFVRAYTKEFIKILADESDPELVCMLMMLCNYEDISHPQPEPEIKLPCFRTLIPLKYKPEARIGSSKVPTIGDFISILDPEIKKDSMRTCIECKLFIKYLQDTFESSKDRDTLKKWLMDNMCHNLSDPEMRESCAKMVDKYSDDFFKAIAEQLDPKAVCIDLKACKKKTIFDMLPMLDPEVEALFRPSPALFERDSTSDEKVKADLAEEEVEAIDDSICEECVSIITKLDEYLSTHAIDDDVNEVIETVCNRLPVPEMKDTCSMIVKSLGQELVEKLHTMDNPRQFCKDVIPLC